MIRKDRSSRKTFGMHDEITFDVGVYYEDYYCKAADND